MSKVQQMQYTFPALTNEEKAEFVNPANPESPFSRFVGNAKAIKRLGRAMFTALGRENHCASDQNFAFFGPASTGKTTLAKLCAELIGLPFVEVHPKSLKSLDDLLEQVGAVLESLGLPLVAFKRTNLKPPPCVIFIDEVHALPDNIVQALLKATEQNDRKMNVSGWNVDCANVLWMIATTDRGDLFDAFDTRFTKIFLELYTKEEIAKIVQLANPNWNLEVCRLVAKYAGRVPREALAFATEMRLEAQMRPSDNWEAVAETIAEDMSIDEFGMTAQRLQILTALGQQGPISRTRLCDIAACKEEELVRFIMPSLMAKTQDQPAFVSVGSRGYVITKDGLDQLDLRGIKTHEAM